MGATTRPRCPPRRPGGGRWSRSRTSWPTRRGCLRPRPGASCWPAATGARRAPSTTTSPARCRRAQSAGRLAMAELSRTDKRLAVGERLQALDRLEAVAVELNQIAAWLGGFGVETEADM